MLDELNEKDLARRLTDAAFRARLVQTMKNEGKPHAVAARYWFLAARCETTPEQLRKILEAIIDGTEEERARLLDSLAAHPNVPEDVLHRLLDEKLCIDRLGHRWGPRSVLERVARQYRYDEAITSLAIFHIGPHGTDEEFANFLSTYKDKGAMRRAVVNASDVPEHRRQFARDFFDKAGLSYAIPTKRRP
jgi:hypothetical protein